MNYFSPLFYPNTVTDKHQTYLYFWKKFGGSNSLDHSAFPWRISSVMLRPGDSGTWTVSVEASTHRSTDLMMKGFNYIPYLNSSLMMVRVDVETL